MTCWLQFVEKLRNTPGLSWDDKVKAADEKVKKEENPVDCELPNQHCAKDGSEIRLFGCYFVMFPGEREVTRVKVSEITQFICEFEVLSGPARKTYKLFYRYDVTFLEKV